jgi:hypothetical protein
MDLAGGDALREVVAKKRLDWFAKKDWLMKSAEKALGLRVLLMMPELELKSANQ